jgi:prepilin-type processing-associated H-X9-DG protein
MFLSIPMALLLTVAVSAQEPADARAAAVAPFVGEEVAVVVHIELARWDAQSFFRRAVSKLADEDDLSAGTKLIDGSVAALKAAGAKDLFLLFEPADMPGLPVAVVPMVDGADGKAIAAVLSGGARRNPFRWPASETIRGAVVAGTPAGLARIRNAVPKARPGLTAAMAAGSDTAIQIAIVPSTTLRRSIEESISILPPELGGAPVTTLTQGLRWASLTFAFEPKPVLRAVVETKDPDATKALMDLAQDALDFLANAARNDPALGSLAAPIGEIKPLAQGDRITLDAELEKTADLVAMPFRQAREVARRSQCTNNLKQITLAMHNYHEAYRTFPPAYSKGPDGKPLLSWRVHILPYLGQKALYDEFHKDEPWDSAHNKTLISRMPAVYHCPSGSPALVKEGKTSYLTPRGPATGFPGVEAVPIQDFTDGTSNTIFVVDANDAAAVTWTKPDDWDISVELKAQSLFGHHPKGTNVGFADGQVRFLKETIDPKVLHDMTTRNGGEIIYWDELWASPRCEKNKRAVPRCQRKAPPFFSIPLSPLSPMHFPGLVKSWP